VAGDFVLPSDPNQKIIFIAGGIGITPFRSMIKYLLDMQQRRPVTVYYANHSVKDIVYQDVLARAERELGIRTIYLVSEKNGIPNGWVGLVGRITPQIIETYTPWYRDSIFYLSGPINMVNGFKDALHRMGIPNSQIKVDFFEGLT
jgi:ferredoxin-NADP reductase